MPPRTYSLRDRILGAYFGSALGDALGGPVEGWHAGMIEAVYGRIEGLVPYARPMQRYDPLGRAGAVTDDTYICDDFAGFFLAHPNEADRTASALVKHLVSHARFEYWWPPAIVPLRKVDSGEITVEEASKMLVGGGAAWWTPIGLVHAGRPVDAYEETAKLGIVWRQPFELNLIAAIEAALAAAVLPEATLSSVTATLFQHAGPLARKLLKRAKRIAETHEDDLDGFVKGIYAEALVEECSVDIDGPMPASAEAKSPYRGATVLWAEQIPLAFAALVFGKGKFVESMLASVALGRDTDSICATTGRLAGGLVGLSGLPSDWVKAVQTVNTPQLDIMSTANRLAHLFVDNE